VFQDYQDKLEKLQLEVKKLKTAQKEHAKLLKNQSQYQQQMDKLRAEVQVNKYIVVSKQIFLELII
jgi:kinesin family protein 4/21/27